MLKSVIVDDEFKSGESLKILIEDFCDDVTTCAICKTVDEGIEAIRTHQPDVVFLDIQMQRETGFDLLEKIGEVDFAVIFTTAHSEYAIKAFRFSAIDYLLKPVDVEELRSGLAKVEKRKDPGLSVSASISQLFKNLKETSSENYKLALPTADGLFFVKVSSIVYCEASSNYTEIVTNDGRKHVVSRTLKEYDELLSEHNFYRIHNSYLVNLDAVKKYIRGEGGSVVMTTGQSLDVSKRKKEGFLARIANREAGG